MKKETTMPTLLQLNVFATVAKTKSFTNAGEKLAMSQSAVSHSIRNLEQEWGFTLFQRHRSGVELTPDGQDLVRHIHQILHEMECLEQTLAEKKGLERGTVRIGSFPTASAGLLPGWLSRYQDAYPGISVEILEGGYAEIKEWIASGEVDLGLITLPEPDFETIPLIEDEYIVIFPADSPFNDRSPVNIEDLDGQPFIMPLAGCETVLRRCFKKHRVQPDIKYHIEHTSTIASMVRHGLGISLIPRMHGEHHSLHWSPLEPPIHRRIGIAFKHAKTLSPAARRWIDMMREKAEAP